MKQVYASLLVHFILMSLTSELQHSIGFMQSQEALHHNQAMVEKIDKFIALHQSVRLSGRKNVIQFTIMACLRLVCIVLPHWFVFMILFDVVC